MISKRLICVTDLSAWILSVAAIAFVGCSKETEPIQEIPVNASSFKALSDASYADDDWPFWRGPRRNGTQPEISVPVKFNPTGAETLWRTKIPGRGHADPTVVGDLVFVATAESSPQSQSVIALDVETGKQQWKTTVHTGGFESDVHAKATQASPTLACDGSHVFAAFLNAKKIYLTALDLKGNQVWQTEVGGFASRFGYSASPTIYKSFVIICADHDDGGFVAALHRETGKIVWRKKREAKSTYASPTIAHVAAKDQLIIIGNRKVISYDPENGDEKWQVAATADSAVGSVVWDANNVFASGGYSQNHTACIAADGTANIVWDNSNHAYVPSLLYHAGHVYCVDDKGRGFCWDAETGKKKWQARVGGNFSASPILAGKNIYVASEEGEVIVFEAEPSEFKELARNEMGTEIFASPVIAKGSLFLRVADRSGGTRQEYLYRIANR